MKKLSFAGSLLLCAAAPALAHTGAGATHGFWAGIYHPLSGLDHLLAMLTVGLWAAQRGGKARWRVPAAFVLTMIAGGALALVTDRVPGQTVEFGITASVLVMGLLVAARVRLPLLPSCLLVGLFALFHGYAHGMEMPADASGLSYSLGFALVTALLHGAGLTLGLLFGRIERRGVHYLTPLTGGMVAVAGGALFLL
ncbi:HupE/UreJ family protein [Edwardsiella piscicida]|uniref:HupE-UreJ family metal transporter n=3 Tax=Edwardsiella TaxID=635 RepID=A0A0H3DY69_EDWTF|nr:HupE/UreJ family protein [Edwardsiella piscicida]ACY85971.1 putative hydrogenase/urease accessory protein [Edwardsiella tarda EIB202]ADM42936.1 HupE-UreJ family metal transporter [Edwardsiella tarda FL6-60]ARD18680.1 hydrogenase [Edwardsiella piscicida]ELM3736509.1 HupE/UreJ family protein [Edwardsiella piscicida]MDM3865900.1 HupE/UreJ family protein [Edwardsiella piscicida]